jgi:Zn-dependent membrane protease YugP
MSYLLYMLPVLLLTILAQIGVKTTYAKYEKRLAASGLTARDVARKILDGAGLSSVPLETVGGQLTDHYDPRAQVIRLSAGVADSRSIAAIGVAAHECGHAIQHARAYFPIKVRQAIIPATNIASRLSVPLLLLGLLFTAYGQIFLTVAYLGVALFGFSVLFQLVTLPVEFNASRRALTILKAEGILQGEEVRGARKVLSAAAMTYVAALAVSLLQLLRLLTLVNGRRR